jgi:hypothetical protein
LRATEDPKEYQMTTTHIALRRIAEATKRLDKAEEMLLQAQNRTFRVSAMLNMLIARRKTRSE